MIYDVLSVDSSFLIKNIDLAFMAWEKPWARDVPFDVFCTYILPYRVQTEKISSLREEMMKRFLPLLDSAGVKTPLEACVALNEHLKSVVRYQAVSYTHLIHLLRELSYLKYPFKFSLSKGSCFSSG